MALTDYINLLQPYVQDKWMQAGIILAVFVILAFVVVFIIDRIVVTLAGKTKTNVDNLIIDKIKKPLFFLVVLFGIQTSLIPLGINSILRKIISSISALIFIYILGAIIGILIHSWGRKISAKTKTKVDETILPLLIKSTNIIFIIIAILLVLNIWKINITPYLAGLGISGLVLGFALQDSLKNIFGGISLILDKSFNIGDKIEIESGELGEIIDIGLRSTKLRTYDNQTLFIPNGQLANMRIRNYVQPNPRIRVVVKFGVEYGTKVEKVKKVVTDVIKKIKDVSDKPYLDVVFIEMGDSALLFQARFWVDDYKIAYDKKLEATEKIYDALNKSRIGIPFPTRTVYMKKR